MCFRLVLTHAASHVTLTNAHAVPRDWNWLRHTSLCSHPREKSLRAMSSSPKKGREGGEGGEWKDIQQKTFTRWCNQNLKSRDMNVDSLATDFHDGIKLINLLEVLSKKSFGRYNKKAKIVQQKHENCTACIKFIQSEGMKLVNIGEIFSDTQVGPPKRELQRMLR